MKRLLVLTEQVRAAVLEKRGTGYDDPPLESVVLVAAFPARGVVALCEENQPKVGRVLPDKFDVAADRAFAVPGPLQPVHPEPDVVVPGIAQDSLQ